MSVNNIVDSFDGYEEYQNEIYLCFATTNGSYILSKVSLPIGTIVSSEAKVVLYGIDHILAS
jgi:hypothetical protein